MSGTKSTRQKKTKQTPRSGTGGAWLRKLITPPAMPAAIRPRGLAAAVRWAGWAILALLPVYGLVMLEYMHFANKQRALDFLLHNRLVWFDLGILYLLWLGILGLVKKGWLATLLFGGACGGAAIANYLKHAMTGDYFYPWDLQQTGNLGHLSHFITVPLPVLYGAMLALVLVLAALVFFSGAQVPLRWPVTLVLTALAAALLLGPVSTPKKKTAVLNSWGLYLESTGHQQSNYQENGFTAAFTVNLLSMEVEKPPAYSRQAVAEALAGYAPVSAGARQPDVIVILSESFWDPTLFPGAAFSRDPLENYRALAAREGVISGRFFTTGFGGGTVRPEFEVLTGMTSDYLPSGSVPWQFVRQETESYVSLYRRAGYRTVALHPYNPAFYDRQRAYPLIGIQELAFQDQVLAMAGEIEITYRGGQISDETFRQALIRTLEQPRPEDAPLFLFGISMENHQPYGGKFETIDVQVEDPSLDAQSLDDLRNFTTGVADADRCLGALADYVLGRDRDTVLVWFGDHLPTLGTNFGAYYQGGIMTGDPNTDFENIYATPYLILANFPLQDGALVHAGPGNDLASYNLLNAVAQAVGSERTAFMEFLSDYGRRVPYYNVRLQRPLSEAEALWPEKHRLLTYDRVAGERYSLTE